MSEIKLNLQKASTALKLNLEKKGIIVPPAIDIGFLMDVSGSFDDEHRSGLTNAIMARIAPWGLVFDPDKKMDVITYSNSARNVEHVGEVNEYNYSNFVEKKIIDQVVGYNGGTDYSYAIKKALELFGWIEVASEQKEEKQGFFKKLFGGSKPAQATEATQKRPAVIFNLTDGENFDKKETEQLINESNSRGDKVFFVFIGASNQSPDFSFLQKLATKYSNFEFHRVTDLNKFINLSDDELNEIFVTPKYLAWLKS